MIVQKNEALEEEFSRFVEKFGDLSNKYSNTINEVNKARDIAFQFILSLLNPDGDTVNYLLNNNHELLVKYLKLIYTSPIIQTLLSGFALQNALAELDAIISALQIPDMSDLKKSRSYYSRFGRLKKMYEKTLTHVVPYHSSEQVHNESGPYIGSGRNCMSKDVYRIMGAGLSKATEGIVKKLVTSLSKDINSMKQTAMGNKLIDHLNEYINTLLNMANGTVSLKSQEIVSDKAATNANRSFDKPAVNISELRNPVPTIILPPPPSGIPIYESPPFLPVAPPGIFIPAPPSNTFIPPPPPPSGIPIYESIPFVPVPPPTDFKIDPTKVVDLGFAAKLVADAGAKRRLAKNIVDEPVKQFKKMIREEKDKYGNTIQKEYTVEVPSGSGHRRKKHKSTRKYY